MKFKIIAAALLAGTTVASAADLPTRTGAPAPVPYAANWSGFYLGGFGGYGWGGKFSSNDGDVASASELSGGFGGGTIGYNWQAMHSQLVWGVEVDVAASDMSLTYNEGGASSSYKVNSFGSVTGRLGTTAFNSALLYVKGGYAWANTKLNVMDGADSFSSGEFHSGFTIGAGLEYLVAPAWSAKVEYMYADYGKGTYGPAPDGEFGRLGLTNHTIKAGINYHFNWGGPVAARY